MSITITVRLRMIERDGVSAMAHVLVFYVEPSIAGLLALACEEEGHVVTTVHMVDDALMVLRSSLHPPRRPVRPRAYLSASQRVILRHHPRPP